MDWKAAIVAIALIASTITSGVAVAGATEATGVSADNTVTRITIEEDGDAVWEVAIRTHLSNETEVKQFNRLQQRIANGTSDVRSFKDRMEAVVEQANQTHDRQMAVKQFSVSAEIQEAPRRWGVVTYRFTWTNFASVSGDRIQIGSVFKGGFYLAENDLLIIEAPDGYQISSVAPEPEQTRSNSVVWKGPTSFDSGHPSVTMTPEPPATTTTATQTSGGSEQQQSKDRATWMIGVLVGGIVAVVSGGTGLWYWRQESSDDNVSESTSSVEEGEQSDADGEEILTGEERVVKLIEEKGGRMKQAQIVDELDDWSESKVSLKLSDMEDEGTIEKLRIGRENVIELAEAEAGERE